MVWLPCGKKRRENANEAHCWQSASEGDDKVLEKMLETLRESKQFSEDQLEELRPKKPVLPTTQSSDTPTSNRFGCLTEPSGKDGNKVVWNFHPLFAPTIDDDSIADLPASLPATAFPSWWETPAGSIDEANKFVEASQKISQRRNEFYANKDLQDPELIRETSEAFAEEGDPRNAGWTAASTRPAKVARTDVASHDAAAQAPGTRSPEPRMPDKRSPESGTRSVVDLTKHPSCPGIGCPKFGCEACKQFKGADQANASPATGPDDTLPARSNGRIKEKPRNKKDCERIDTDGRVRSRSPVPQVTKAKVAKDKAKEEKTKAAGVPPVLPEMEPVPSAG